MQEGIVGTKRPKDRTSAERLLRRIEIRGEDRKICFACPIVLAPMPGSWSNPCQIPKAIDSNSI